METPVLIGVVRGCGGEHQQLAVGDIHDDGCPFLGLPRRHLLRQSLDSQFLQTAIKRELQAEIISIKHTRSQIVGKWRSVGTPPHAAGLFVTHQLLITALLETCLGHTIVVEKPDDIGEQRALWIDPLRIGLQVQSTDAQGSDLCSRLRIKALCEPDPRGALSHLGLKAAGRNSDQGRQPFRHVRLRTDVVRVISREVEIARMSPETESLLIHGHQTPGAIDDRASLTQWLGALGLQPAGTGFKGIGLHQLKPGHPSGQANQTGAQHQEHHPQTSRRHLLKRHHPGTASTLGPGGRRGGLGCCSHQYPARIRWSIRSSRAGRSGGLSGLATDAFGRFRYTKLATLVGTKLEGRAVRLRRCCSSCAVDSVSRWDRERVPSNR